MPKVINTTVPKNNRFHQYYPLTTFGVGFYHPPGFTESVASVLPSSTTPFVLGTGASDTELDPSSVSPIHGISKFPTPISCLLDNGVHLVLIRLETIADLGIKICKLHTPQTASIAINSQHHTFLLADYVVLSLSLLNNAWTSYPIRALITADLCVNIPQITILKA